MMSGNEKLVCVTGASGYIASWLVKLLLNRGYTVRASVRDTYDRTKTAHLKAMTGANDRLKLFEADLLKDGSFYSGIQDCVGVFHTASPFELNSKNPEEELIKPAVNGTLNVLKSCATNPSLKRVVLTSSTAAVVHTGIPREPGVVVDETSYSSREFCEKSEYWYPLSKTLAEEAAWGFANENGIDLVTINPATVLGPLLQPTPNTSAEVILSLINGEKTYINGTYGWVNVQDVAKAHILAYEDSKASGRYLMVENVFSCSEIVEMIRELYPSIPLPEKCADDKPRKATYQFSKERAKSLEIDHFIPTKTGLKEIVKSLIERGLVKS